MRSSLVFAWGAEIAAILIPWPDQEGEHYNELCERAQRERDEYAEDLRLGWQEAGLDPVLASVGDARSRMLAAEQDLRWLLAYAREFTHPRPYTLAGLAAAAGMSISGVRTSYDQDEIDHVAGALKARS